MIRSLRIELRAWPAARWWIAFGVGAGAGALLTVTGNHLSAAGRVPWWAWMAIGAGALVFGLTFATFRGPPAGAEPVVCDLRWPALGFVGLSLATEQASTVPMIDPLVRPIVALAALGVLVYGLADRMSRERSMLRERRRLEAGGESAEGITCTTCRPLFPAHRDATTPVAADDVGSR